MDRLKARPLQNLNLNSRPLSPHALAWSCDAELAVVTAESIHIFLPEYGKGSDEAADEKDTSQYQFPMCFQPSSVIQPRHELNAQLCAQAGIELFAPQPGEDTSFRGVGNGIITGSGSALGQAIRVEWSPNGLGCNLRPILMALTTNGSLIAFGEHIHASVGVYSAVRTRNFKNWRTLWGLGANLPIPDSNCGAGYGRMEERIVSFAWAHELGAGRAVLAYANDAEEIVIMAVQFYVRQHDVDPAVKQEPIWDIKEISRFSGKGPHSSSQTVDPDFNPSGTIFSLKWSPWIEIDDFKTATLAYVTKGYVGFRRFSIQGIWEKGEAPDAGIEEIDTVGMCLYLSSDAFIQWEDAVWHEGDVSTARGIVTTPFTIKSFQVALNGALANPAEEHSAWDCSSLYPQDEDTNTNPITGLVIHPPNPSNKPPTPYFTLVRLSATATNNDWYQTNLPEDQAPLPQWAEDISNQLARIVDRDVAMTGVDSDFDSDLEDGEEKPEEVAPKIQVHPFRFRLWGLALSPGSGCSALLASKHTTQHPNRRGFCNVHFDWQVPADEGETSTVYRSTKKLTTEGKLWEWMYGLGEDVPGLTCAVNTTRPQSRSSSLREQFRNVAANMTCVFCGKNLDIQDEETICEDGHGFATCTISGIPIMAPGISRFCGVCRLRCLKVGELSRLAEEHFGSSESLRESTGQSCGGCGGKFVI